MEELVLTDPVIIPSQTTAKYKVIILIMNFDLVLAPQTVPGAIFITLKDNNNITSSYTYSGQAAIDMMKFLNTANMTTKSMHKRILEKLSNDGLLPGSVTGTPDPPVSDEL